MRKITPSRVLPLQKKPIATPTEPESVEERRCDPPETPAPAAPVLVLMSSLLSMMTSIPSLERRRSHLHCQCIMCWKDLATPIESAPDTQGTETSAPAIDIPVYSVVNKTRTELRSPSLRTRRRVLQSTMNLSKMQKGTLSSITCNCSRSVLYHSYRSRLILEL
ncbi:hypothetical protein GBAR_LOCUS24350 [Geodia barretti]|uniref:Uncharacterized protein n=1 Tax=Geodia barretti TaxID=519541 RepID=A0AA35XA36_GEOBA|nr:hypothetical protein GBAR_LOCUS24350 [Geodia barretti]